jgi:carboxylesterase type B
LTAEQFKVQLSGPGFRPRFGPTVDGTFLTQSPFESIEAGNFQRKNVLLGVNNDETGYFLLFAYPQRFNWTETSPIQLTPADFRSLIGEMIPLNPAQVSAAAFEYSTPCTFEERQSLSYFRALVALIGDREFKCPAVHDALAFAKQSQIPGENFAVYVYKFTHRDPVDPWPQWAGQALHGDEISFVFGRPFNPAFVANYTDSERALSDKIITFWTNFAKSGDPNKNNDTGSLTPDDWPTYTTTERIVMTLDTGDLKTTAGLRDQQCDFWNVLVPELGATTAHGTRLAGAQTLTALLILVVRIGQHWLSR